MEKVELKPGIYWVGGIDWDIREFHGYLTQRGTTYNAYLIIDEKIVLVDTVKHYLFDEMLARIKEIDISVVFVEQKNGSVKVSWRSRPGFDVSIVATQFGGGGHKPAAGADIKGDLKRVQEEVLEATKKSLQKSD